MVFKAYKEIDQALKLAKSFEQVVINKATIYNVNSLANIQQNQIITQLLNDYFMALANQKVGAEPRAVQ